MRIYVCGSLAYDRIMPFPGKFSDHILPDKIHILNVCFLVNGVVERFGGTAGNIAYSLRLLGESPVIIGCVGKDFAEYDQWLRKLDLPLEGLRIIDDELTAGAYITTDQADNQITGFNPGAMRCQADYRIDRSVRGGALGIVAPGNVLDMVQYPSVFRELNVPYIFDPGQQITALSGEQLLAGLTGAQILISNDYELELIMKSTGCTRAQLLEKCETVITTLGEKGALVVEQDGETLVKTAKPTAVKDPTGAGDAFRAGLIKGIIAGKSLPEAAQLGATCSSFCIEKAGTQEHAFDMATFQARHDAAFK